MARLRLLFALLLIAAGTCVGALALSGYYGSSMRAQPLAAAAESPVTPETFRRLLSRQRLVANDGQAATPMPSQPTTAQTPKARAPVKRPKQAAAPWPWSWFGN
jgi:hypothetical protein